MCYLLLTPKQMIYNTEPVPLRCSSKEVLCKSPAKLQESTHAELLHNFFWNRISVWVSSYNFATYLQDTLLKRSYGGLLLKIIPLCK